MIMDTPLVSIVVPIYKSADYLIKCVESLVNQTLKEIEIILVNDASPDPADDRVCNYYASNDKRVKYLVHQRNKGQGGARNTGIVNSSSTFIGFVDSDDWVEPEMFEKLYDAILREGTDVSQCYFTEHNGKKANIRKLKSFKRQKDFLNATNVLVWNKLFKKSLFTDNDIFFPEGHSHEDTATLPRLVYFVNSMAPVKEPLYHYIAKREGSTTANYERIFSDHSIVFQEIKDFMIEMDVWDTHRNYFENRMIRSLQHDLSRLIKEPSLEEKRKQTMVNEGLEKTIKLLSHPNKISMASLKETRRSLSHYKQKLIIKHLVGF